MVELDWRPLVFVMMVALVMLIWVVGCTMLTESQNSRSNGTSTPYPRVTLTTGRMLLPISPTYLMPTTTVTVLSRTPTEQIPNLIGSPPTEIAPITPSYTATPTDNIALLNQPTCFENETGRTVCLGRVENMIDDALVRVGVNVNLFLLNGEQNSANTFIEQSVIFAGESAPYRVAFDTLWTAYAGVSANLISAEVSAEGEKIFAAVIVENSALVKVGGRTSVNATIFNPNEETIYLMQAVITLLDANGHVYGYRVLDLAGESLFAGETLPLSVEIMAQSTTAELSHIIYVEALNQLSY